MNQDQIDSTNQQSSQLQRDMWAAKYIIYKLTNAPISATNCSLYHYDRLVAHGAKISEEVLTITHAELERIESQSNKEI